MEKSEQISRLEGLISRLRESDLDEEESRVLDQQILHCERILGDDTVEPEDNSMNGSYCLVDESAAEQGKDADDMDVFDRIQDTAAVLSLHNSALKVRDLSSTSSRLSQANHYSRPLTIECSRE